MKVGQIEVPMDAMRAFCEKWKVAQLSLFGSVLRDDFRPDSDVDVLIVFGPGGEMTFEGGFEMMDELSRIFGGREIHLVEKRLLKNPFRRYEILTTREVVYAA
jgi:predicted nucleotidyltransferase